MQGIELNRDRLTVHVQGIDRLLALRRRLDIPYDHIVSVEARARVPGPKGLRAIEARLPAAIAPRTFYQRGGTERTGSLVIGVYGERYRRLVIALARPEAAAAAIRSAVRGAGTGPRGRFLASEPDAKAPKTSVGTRTRGAGVARSAAG